MQARGYDSGAPGAFSVLDLEGVSMTKAGTAVEQPSLVRTA
jgi:hypothetical protein